MSIQEDNKVRTLTHFSIFEKEHGDSQSSDSEQIHEDASDDTMSKRIRSILELHMRDVITEVSFTQFDNDWSVSMRGVFHCQECLKKWMGTKRNAEFHCSQEASQTTGRSFKFNKEEAIHIIKLLKNDCYTSDVSVLYILNSINNDEGNFWIQNAECDRSGDMNSFGPLLFVSSTGKRMPGTFDFELETDNRRAISIFSPKFKVASRIKGRVYQICPIPIFTNKNESHFSRRKKKQIFTLANGDFIDLKRVFSYGLLLSCSKRWFFFSGRMKKDLFQPSACVSDTAMLYQWSQDEEYQEQFLDAKEIFVKTKLSFPAFPCDKINNAECEWKLVNNRCVSEVSERFLLGDLNRSNIEGSLLYIGGKLIDNGTLTPKNRLQVAMKMPTSLQIRPKNGRFKKVVFDDCLSTPSESQTSSSLLDDVMLRPSGTAVSDGSAATSKNLDGGRRSSDRVVRTASIISFREIDPSEEREVVQRRRQKFTPETQAEVLNPTVKNRTGCPTTKAGKLSDGNSNIKRGVEKVKKCQRTTMTNLIQESIAVSSMLSKLGSGAAYDSTNLVTSLQAAGLYSGNQAQRDTERKAIRETGEVNAKYRNTTTHSLPLSDAQDQTTFGQTKTGIGASPFQNKTTSEAGASMRGHIGEDPASTSIRIHGKTVKEQRIEESKEVEKETDPTQEGIPTAFFHNYFLKENAKKFRWSKLSRLPGYDNEGIRRTSISSHFPFLDDGFTILNFTENYKFSYFNMPGYVKENNKNVKKGFLKLPVIKAQVKGARQEKEDSTPKARTNLIKRIEKLNRFEGNQNPRVRQ